MMNEVNLPLVSVGVYTYNSSKTVIETLESIKSQTYPNLELIVSDDCSTDNTVSLCQDWLEHNKDRFVDTKIIVPDKNTGQSGNYNRALKASNGEWIKDIDGDDLLTPNCIEDYIEFVKSNPEAIFVFGRTEVFGPIPRIVEKYQRIFDYDFFKLSIEDKYKRLITRGNCIASPSAFSNARKRKELDLWYDERIPLLEDLPMWVNATKRGFDLFFLDKIVCLYRVGGNGITSGNEKKSDIYMIGVMKYELYYLLNIDDEYHNNFDDIVTKIAEREWNMIKEQIDKYENSKEYKLGSFLCKFYRRIRNIIRW